jgi:tetratricopeptide (TPR) repeat protein
MARLKLIAGLLGVGLDELVQRETHRRYRRMFAATAASVSGMVVMALLTLFAFQARSDAVDARGDAEERRAAAEDLIEFMLGDLTERLGPVGRLEVLDAVGTKALDYYGYAEPGELDTDSLARRARAMTLIGEIQGLRGNLQEASQAFQRSQETTGELMRRAPDDTQRIYDHAQSTFWMGYIHWQRGNQERAEPLFEAYLSLAERLTEIEPENTDWQVELGYGKVNMGALLMDRGEWAPAARAFRDGQRIFHTLVAHDPLRADWQIGLSDTHSWLASAFVELGNLAGARIERELELEIYRTVLAKDPNNSEAGAGLARSNRHLARQLLMTGETDASLKAYERATSLARQRLQNDPENSASAQLAGSVYISHAEALLTLGQTSKAERALVRADAVTQGLLGKDRSVLKWRVELYCQSEIARSHLYLLTGNLGRGLRHSTRVIKELSDLRGDHPDNQIIVFLLAQAHLIAGRLQDAAGRPDEARAAWQNTVTILISTGDRLKPQARADLAWAKLYLGQQDEARDLIRPLDDIGYAHPHFLALKSRLNEDEKA